MSPASYRTAPPRVDPFSLPRHRDPDKASERADTHMPTVPAGAVSRARTPAGRPGEAESQPFPRVCGNRRAACQLAHEPIGGLHGSDPRFAAGGAGPTPTTALAMQTASQGERSGVLRTHPALLSSSLAATAFSNALCRSF